MTEKPDRRMRKSLRGFDLTSRLLREFLVGRYGEAKADSLVRDARARYEEILPRVSWADGPRGRSLNAFLGITAQEIAVYQAVEARGGTASEAWEICHRAIRVRLAHLPAWRRWLMNRLMFSKLAQAIVRRRAANEELVRGGDFVIRSVMGDGKDFDFGIDYVRCGNLELARKVGAEAFAPYICMSDIALSDALGWGLVRTQTLADGCAHCDFRFKQGGETRISSPTADVQETVDRIAREEAGAVGAQAMPTEHPNVALLNRFDPQDVGGTVEVFAENVVWHYFHPFLPEIQGDYEGRSGVQEFFAKVAELSGGTFAVQPISVTAVGDELVVAHTRNTLTLGDRDIATEVVVVWRVVDGQIAEVWDIPSVHGQRG